MSRKKLLRNKLIEKVIIVIEESKKKFFKTKNNWHVEFANNNPIVLELACGQGEYSIALAKCFPNTNFIGVDIKGERLWQAAQKSKDLENIRFLKVNIREIYNHFAKGEISEILIIHPDPFPKNPKKRLVDVEFLDIYKKLCKKNTQIHLKTDSPELAKYFIESSKKRELVKAEKPFYSDILFVDLKTLGITTNFQQKAIKQGKNISFLTFII